MKDNIHKELQQIDSELLEMSQINAFRVPDDYFDQLESGLFERLDIHIDAPSEAYFDTMQTQVIERTKEDQKEAKIISINYRRWLSVASMVVICMMSGVLLLDGDTDSEDTAESWVIDESDGLDYLAFNYELPMTDLIELVDEEMIDEFVNDDLIDLEDVDFYFDDLSLEELEEI